MSCVRLALRAAPPSAALLCVGVLASCGGGEQAPTGPPGAEDVSAVEVSPAEASVDALDDTVHFEATARDDDGDAIPDVSFSWSSSDPDVATVDGDGTATARGDGEATITAEVRGVSGSGSLTVDQSVQTVVVSPRRDSLEAGDTGQLTAEARDPNGLPVEDVSSFEWSSSDRSVASVDSTGLVTAESRGTAAITASAEGVTGSASVDVLPASTPTVTSISPSPLREGGAATISGDDFSSTPSDNSVTVDGTAANVTAATPTELQIQVPVYDCRPARRVAVTVTVDQKTSIPKAADVEPDEAPVALDVGEQRLVRDPAQLCLQFSASDSARAFVVGVQSVSEDISTLTPVEITGTSSGSGGSAARASARFSPLAPVLLAGRPVATHVAGTHAAGRRPAGTVSAAPAPSKASVGPGVSEGDTVELKIPGTAPCRDFTRIEGIVREKSAHAVFVEDVGNPDGGFTSSDWTSLGATFDDPIHPTDLEYFGAPSDLDGNGRTVIVVSKELNRTGRGAFVLTDDLDPSSSCAGKNGGEIIYSLAPDPDGQFGRALPTGAAFDQTLSILAHEFTHVIQVSRRIQRGAPQPVPWMLEGQAGLAEELVGHRLSGRTARQDYGDEIALGGDRDNWIWYRSDLHDLGFYFGHDHDTGGRVGAAPEECSWLTYAPDNPGPCFKPGLVKGVPWSFLRWLTDQVGVESAGGPAALHRDLVDSDSTGFANVERATGQPIEELLAQWAAALYVDERIQGGGRLEFPSWDLRDIFGSAREHFIELQPAQRPFGDFAVSASVRAASTAYLLIAGDAGPATAVAVRSRSGSPLPAHMQVWLVRTQ